MFPLFPPPFADFFALGWLFSLLSPPFDLSLLLLPMGHRPHCCILLLVPFICSCGSPSPLRCFTHTVFVCICHVALLSQPLHCTLCSWCCWHYHHNCSLMEPSNLFVFCFSTIHCAFPMLVMPPLLSVDSCCQAENDSSVTVATTLSVC